MRIAAISNSRVPSVTANSIQAMKVCDALVQLGHEVRLFVPAEVSAGWIDRTPGTLWAFSGACGRVATIAAAGCAAWISSGAPASGRGRIELSSIYTWLPQTAALAALAAPSNSPRNARGRGGTPGRAMVAAGDALAANPTPCDHCGAATRAGTLHGRDFSESAIQVAPNGVDLERYENLPSSAAARAALGLPEGFTIGFTGHFYAGAELT